MRIITAALAFSFIGCASADTRAPLADVPPGNYYQVEPATDVHTVVALNESAWTVRTGDEVESGTHWVDSDGRVHIIADAGQCAGMESVWTYRVMGNRLVMEQVSNACEGQQLPMRWVWERR